MGTYETEMYKAKMYRMEEHVCRICGKRNINKTYTAKEMMYGTREKFDYFVCENCNCMQIAKIPEDLGNYYSGDYYSFAEREKIEFEGKGDVGRKVLDVGCGSGKWLLNQAENGYGNLYGCDPFIHADICYGDRVYIKKCDIREMDGKFDLIRFGDSFEHVTNPSETLESVKRLLKEDGKCEIHIPVFPNAARVEFGVNWYQLDAPRHIFLYSENSMRYLCEKCGLEIEEMAYNSTASQFLISYLYTMGLSLQKINELVNSILAWNGEIVDGFEKLTKESNKRRFGDHAIFNIVHK